MTPREICGLIVPKIETVRQDTEQFLEKRSDEQAFNTDDWTFAFEGKQWVQDFLLDRVRQRLKGSSQRLGALLVNTLAPGREEMYDLGPDTDTDLGRTSWAALTYLAVLHSHDSWHQRWHHDFYTADAAWNPLSEKLGEKSARRVCAMIAFQNTLRGVFHSPASREVSIYESSKTFCEDYERCAGKLKAVISAALAEEALPPSYWRSCAYAALALDGRRWVSSPNTKSHPDEVRKDLDNVEKFVGAAQTKPEHSSLLSLEYANYLEKDPHDIRPPILQSVPHSGAPKHFRSISLGRHWRKSDVEKLHKEICSEKFSEKFSVAVDIVPHSWCAVGDSDKASDRFSFHHVERKEPFDLWLDIRIPDLELVCNGSSSPKQTRGAPQ